MRVYTLLILLVLGGLSMGYGQQLPADFPKYIDTGNAERDMTDFATRKAEWVKANANAYQAYQTSLLSTLTKEVVNTAENKLQPLGGLSKQAAEKEVEMSTLYVEKQIVTRDEYKEISFSIPKEWLQNGFPSFDTYPSIDEMLQQRIMWIHTHPDIYLLALRLYGITVDKIVGSDLGLQNNLQELAQNYIRKMKVMQDSPALFEKEQVEKAIEFLTVFEKM